MLGEPIHVLAAIRIRLEKKAEQDYAAVFAALEHLATATVDATELQAVLAEPEDDPNDLRSEEHTSELQSLMRISYAVFCLKKKKKPQKLNTQQTTNQDRRTHKHKTHTRSIHNKHQ